MKKTNIAFLLVSVFLVIAGCSKKKEDKNPGINFERFAAEFKIPPASFAPAPLFVWNTLITKEELDFQLQELKDKGFGGVFVHPRPGLVNEYLSEDWFDLFGYTLERCKKLGMDVWIYDENSYPSGFAGGYVPEQMPSSFNEGQGLKGTIVQQLPGDLSPYAIVLKKEGDKWVDISGTNGKQVKGEFCLFEKTYYGKSPWFGGFSYVDLLKKGVTEKFIDVTFREGYQKHFPRQMGKEIKGAFSDEPGIYAPDAASIRWTPDLFEYFRKECGYDLKVCLPLLYEETGNWKKVRYDYYKTLLKLYVERWGKSMMAYCDQQGLQWTGHYWEHEWPDPYQGPDNMAMYEWHQLPAIDMLYNDFNETRCNNLSPNHWPQAQFGNARAVRELSSVANQLGKKRVLSETYGGCGWDLSFNDMKRLGDWEFALGVNFLCQHLVDMSIKGARKYDYPPSFSYHEPWWNQYKYLNGYFTRLSYALSSGEQHNPVLVIEPTNTTWMYAARGKISDHLVSLGQSFHLFIHQLEKLQVEYDLGSESIIGNHGSVNRKNFRVGNRDYRLVIIPKECETLDSATVSLLKTYLENGGKVLCLGSPTTIGGEENPEVYAGLKSSSGWIAASGLEETVIQEELFFEDWKVLQNDTASGKFYHQRRILPNGQLLFVVNSDKEKMASETIGVKGKMTIRFDPFTGHASAFPSVAKGNNLRLKIDLHPSESVLLYIPDEDKSGFESAKPQGNQTEIAAERPMKIASGDKNVLAIDFCDLKLKDSFYHDIHVIEAGRKVYQAHGFAAGNPWHTKVQFRSETLKQNIFQAGTGFTASYSFEIADDVDFSKFEAVVEGANPAPRVLVNGHKISAIEGCWWLDRSFPVYPVGKALKAGMNRIDLVTNPMNVFVEVEPIYILGDFTLESKTKGWKITQPNILKTGSWKEQGWPFYARSVDYSQEFNIQQPGTYRVQLPCWSGSVAEVLVNGQSSGIIFVQPYNLDISEKLKTGMNTVTIRVMGSNRNLFGPFHGRLPVGLASPSQWDNIQEYPSGSSYQQLDYGLFGPFILLKEERL
jgi:hypothetical protein